MKIAIVVSTNDPEVVWNAAECIQNENFNVTEQLRSFVENKGEILACGSCLKVRQKESPDVCPISTMRDLLQLVEESDKLLTFG